MNNFTNFSDLRKNFKTAAWLSKQQSLTRNNVVEIQSSLEQFLKADEDLDCDMIQLAFEIGCEYIITRFHYHFSGNRPTNRLDKVRMSYFLSAANNLTTA